MRRPHNRTFKRAADELRTAADVLRRAQAGASDRYDPALRASRARYARVRAKIVMASSKARAEDWQLRIRIASVVLICAVALALVIVVDTLPVPFVWLAHAEFIAAMAGLALAGAVWLILYESPGKTRDAVLSWGLQGISWMVDGCGLFRKQVISRKSGSERW
ncbi:MAG: hypothetical protein OXC70_05160 [Gammaproteobacteria bacterium]|nr:hypothetical protein [Gammaproteobacteria bacterium]